MMYSTTIDGKIEVFPFFAPMHGSFEPILYFKLNFQTEDCAFCIDPSIEIELKNGTVPNEQFCDIQKVYFLQIDESNVILITKLSVDMPLTALNRVKTHLEDTVQQETDDKLKLLSQHLILRINTLIDKQTESDRQFRIKKFREEWESSLKEHKYKKINKDHFSYGCMVKNGWRKPIEFDKHKNLIYKVKVVYDSDLIGTKNWYKGMRKHAYWDGIQYEYKIYCDYYQMTKFAKDIFDRHQLLLGHLPLSPGYLTIEATLQDPAVKDYQKFKYVYNNETQGNNFDDGKTVDELIEESLRGIMKRDPKAPLNDWDYSLQSFNNATDDDCEIAYDCGINDYNAGKKRDENPYHEVFSAAEYYAWDEAWEWLDDDSKFDPDDPINDEII